MSHQNGTPSQHLLVSGLVTHGSDVSLDAFSEYGYKTAHL